MEYGIGLACSNTRDRNKHSAGSTDSPMDDKIIVMWNRKLLSFCVCECVADGLDYGTQESVFYTPICMSWSAPTWSSTNGAQDKLIIALARAIKTMSHQSKLLVQVTLFIMNAVSQSVNNSQDDAGFCAAMWSRRRHHAVTARAEHDWL